MFNPDLALSESCGEAWLKYVISIQDPLKVHSNTTKLVEVEWTLSGG